MSPLTILSLAPAPARWPGVGRRVGEGQAAIHPEAIIMKKVST